MIQPLHDAVAARAARGGLPITASAIAELDRMLVEERSRHCQPVGARGEVKGAAVHALENGR